MKTLNLKLLFINIFALIVILPSIGLLAPDMFRGAGGGLYAQAPDLIDNSWFVHRARNSNASNSIWDNSTFTFQELKFELTFLSDKIIMTGCCGGVFEMDVNYISNNELEILNLVEIETTPCNETFVSGFYNAIKGAYTSFIGESIAFTIQNSSFHSGVKEIVFNHPTNYSFIEISNTPVDLNGTAPYYGHEPPTHIWSLTQVQYQGQTMELPYGAALTVADIYEGTFQISLCGEIFVALNSSWYLDVEDFQGPCFISCGILENTSDVCEPVTGYDVNYLETFKQNAFNFLNDNITQTMDYTFTFGSARKLIIQDYSQNKLIFHSNANYLSTQENKLLPAITIYPNPANELLSIYTTYCDLCTIKVYNTNGTLLYRENLTSPQGKIDVKQLSTGIYFVVVENYLGIKQTRKFVKK